MRIERLDLERYGIFTDRSLAFRPEAALHVVLGPNEGGKTSALSAIGDLLFGFSARTDYDFRHESKSLRIGGAFRHSDGRLIVTRRRKGNKNTLIGDDDQALPDDTLVPLLGNLSRDAFSREFGLTAQALRDGGADLLNAGGRLAETLAASSAGMTALSRVRERLQSEAEDLFTPRKSAGKLFYQVADRRDSADRALRDAIVTRESVQDLETAVEEARANLEALNAEHAHSGSTLARWQRTLRVRSKLARLDGIAAELADVADLPAVPPQTLADWRAALDTDAGLMQDITALDSADALEAAEIAAMKVDDGVLAEAIAIDALRERLGAVRKAIDDLPRRRQSRDDAVRSLEDAARRLGMGSHDILLERLPTDAALARVRDCIGQLNRAAQALAEAETRQARAQSEHDALAVEEGGHQAIGDLQYIKQRFEALGDIPAQADRHRRDMAALKSDTQGLDSALAAIDPALASLDQLRALPLPEHVIIAKFVQAIDVGDNEIKRLGDALATTDELLGSTEVELARLRGEGEVPNRADLIKARQQRDAQLGALGAVLDSDARGRLLLFSEVSQSSKAIDGITDLLLADTERATRHEDALQRLAALRTTRDRDAGKLQGLQARLAEVTTAWTALWAPAGLAPRSPAEMLLWRGKVEDILARLGKMESQRTNLDALAASLESGKAACMTFLGSVGRIPDASLPVDNLFREAKARVEELQAVWAEAKARAAALQRVARELSEADAAVGKAHATLAAQRQAWPAAMDGIGLPDTASAPEADAALAVWQSVALPKANHESESHRVQTIEADLKAFDADVFGMIDLVAPHHKSTSAQESLARLSAALAEARTASESYRRLQRNASQRAAIRNTLIAQRQAAGTLLDEACRAIGVGRDDLSASIALTAARHLLEGERVILERDLDDIADGCTEATLRQEREGIDLDLLPGNIAREEVRQTQLLRDIAEASANHHERKNRLELLLKGRNAPALAAERAEAGAELQSVAERWLVRAAASRLALRAIERHRAMVQDPLIARASVLFSMATNEAFAGLVIDYGDDDQPVLVAKRHTGEQVSVAGLSEGTRDQLFLALRLALLERRTSEPIPFIGDDLLSSFDEKRTSAMLRLLVAAGQQQQIILFTHHRHVVDLARSVNEQSIEVIDL
ncbi:YhaN family protein [Bradyrhizobium sp. CSS354]|uniref:YhaN family protein n=1 Tax=Bradyrhizobium sp. CSS354 TaxID=2699172 RepID=UPI0023AF80F3|nr:YhaN family protein [Bradyrhizobium sp. CSS354]MDE5464752.1 AAA family ATPase [Bradyrhizobium sp. CSS354]